MLQMRCECVCHKMLCKQCANLLLKARDDVLSDSGQAYPVHAATLQLKSTADATK